MLRGWGNYNFGYDEDHTSGGSFRRETGNALGAKVGSYGLRDADGRARVVSYVADELGFRASISTNEPGTMPSTPADVSIGATPQGTAAPAVPVAAPAPAAYSPPARIHFNGAPAARPAYASPAPVAPLSYGAPSPFAFKSAPVARVSYAAPSPFPVKASPTRPASYGGVALAPSGHRLLDQRRTVARCQHLSVHHPLDQRPTVVWRLHPSGRRM
ncbi:adult-specific rigid cuticular protein 15.7-like [Dermacentor albipictus]|uniref:adult-specific rigid cuticular protein 15.7-like n=1 Tax=Dermacentor albipictus TaxID=60249 RepID=UPI0038FCB9F9